MEERFPRESGAQTGACGSCRTYVQTVWEEVPRSERLHTQGHRGWRHEGYLLISLWKISNTHWKRVCHFFYCHFCGCCRRRLCSFDVCLLCLISICFRAPTMSIWVSPHCQAPWLTLQIHIWQAPKPGRCLEISGIWLDRQETSVITSSGQVPGQRTEWLLSLVWEWGGHAGSRHRVHCHLLLEGIKWLLPREVGERGRTEREQNQLPAAWMLLALCWPALPAASFGRMQSWAGRWHSHRWCLASAALRASQQAAPPQCAGSKNSISGSSTGCFRITLVWRPVETSEGVGGQVFSTTWDLPPCPCPPSDRSANKLSSVNFLITRTQKCGSPQESSIPPLQGCPSFKEKFLGKMSEDLLQVKTF